MARVPEHVNMVKIDDGHTALHIAAANDHLDLVRLLASVVRMCCFHALMSFSGFRDAADITLSPPSMSACNPRVRPAADSNS